MERKLLALVFLALAVGLGVGYCLGFLVYLPQLQELQNGLRNMPTGDITVEQARLLKQYDLTLKIVDVRTPEEYASGHSARAPPILGTG